MNAYNKKALSVLLLCSFIFSISACGQQDGLNAPADNAAVNTDVGSSETTAEETTEEPSEYTSPDRKYDGADFTVASMRRDDNSLWIAYGYREMFSEEENGDPINDALFIRNRQVMDKLDINIKHYDLSSDAGKDFLKIAMSGDDIIDIGIINTNNIPTVMNSDTLIDLNTLSGVDFSHSWLDHNETESLTILKRLYAATGDITLGINLAPITIFFNKQLHENLGLENPYALVENGSWTLAKSMEMSYAAAADLNGDGKADVDDQYGMMFENATLYSMLYAGGVRLTTNDAEGVPQISVNVDLASSIFDLFSPFMADKTTNLIDGQFPAKNCFTDIMLPKFKDNHALFFNNQLLVALNLRSMDTDFGILPPPKYLEESDSYHVPINLYWAMFAVVPKTNTRTELCSDVMEAMGYYGQKYLTKAYVETTIMDKAIRDEDSLKMLDIIFSSRVYDSATLYDWGGMRSVIGGLVGKSEGAFATAFAKNESKIQKGIDKTLASFE